MTERERTAYFQSAIQCAPVLAGIKPSNLLQVESAVDPRIVRGFLEDTGLVVAYLYRSGGKRAWLVYRPEELEAILSDPDRRTFLERCGYCEFDTDAVLRRLRTRLADYRKGEEYPHEVGILLGYPLADVCGFVEQGGKNCLYSGYWKVYGDVTGAQRLFASIRKARHFSAAGARRGMSFRELKENMQGQYLAAAV